mmetsp:Transcript_433/g.810  ORF Transcript_433/g.810 Transcript_433/m.810 type:complete len:320 (-) Transcript_433:252-1211(-)|eukprot:CAMPEP_0119336822 /NCGR_PEP_ID=MMETSP1333-20130426/92684_1 /TAXON_ID=418940 /ORGANISM="Scyphosphaera apsteinii, Strain RCC1455" /LENGTH=319 /DNA_ID=CAMNT_0007347699 /DNA_START=23 /DNA_END=982 /DNA_ORIENTATION=-
MTSFRKANSFFSTESGCGTRLIYLIISTITAAYGADALLAPFVTPACDATGKGPRRLVQGLEGGLEDAPNPSYQPDPCRWQRYVALLGMNKWEADMCRRVILALIMGSIIGFERRRVDRPAGIRTMAMVCLGSCVFTIGSMFAFLDGSMGWDASRVSAAIPSGVGFLGAASIWKGTKEVEGSTIPEVHGLTTATSVWLSAAVGIFCGGGLYVPAFFSAFASIVFLRFAPRLDTRHEQEQEIGKEDAKADRAEAGLAPIREFRIAPSISRDGPPMASLKDGPMASLREPLNPQGAEWAEVAKSPRNSDSCRNSQSASLVA